MALNIRTATVIKEPDGKFVATYEAFDTSDPDTVKKKFQIDGYGKADLAQKLAAKVESMKQAATDKQTKWIAMSDAVIADLKAQGVL